MTPRAAAGLALCVLALVAVPWVIGNEFYVNMRLGTFMLRPA